MKENNNSIFSSIKDLETIFAWIPYDDSVELREKQIQLLDELKQARLSIKEEP